MSQEKSAIKLSEFRPDGEFAGAKKKPGLMSPASIFFLFSKRQKRCRKIKKRLPDRRIAQGRVKTQAVAMLTKVLT